MFIIWGDRASGHPAHDPSTAGRDVGAGDAKAYCLADKSHQRLQPEVGLGGGRKPAWPRIPAAIIISNLLERVLKECLPGNADLHVAG